MYRYTRRLGCFLFLPFLGVVSLCLSIHLYYFANTPFLLKKDLTFYIEPKATIYHLTANLIERGVLKNPRLFLVLAYLKNASNNLQTGEYQLEVGITPSSCLNRFKTGKVRLHRFTIVEGWRSRDLLTSLKQDKRFKNTQSIDFIKILRTELSFSANSLEGLFFPESYDFPRDTLKTEILKRAFQLMQNQLNIAWAKRAPNLPWKNSYEALIAASLVEKETALIDERAKIAGVIVRRLQKGIPLQIDASVIYGLGKHHQGRLRTYELKIDTPYNTYRRQGLPPTPIAIPSLSSIEAVLNPDLGNAYLYFVAKNDGQHTFSDHLKEHYLAVKRYRQTERARQVR